MPPAHNRITASQFIRLNHELFQISLAEDQRILNLFPGIFKGALEGRATAITEEMKLATAKAIAGLVPDEELNENNILPEAFDPRVADVVSRAVKELI